MDAADRLVELLELLLELAGDQRDHQHAEGEHHECQQHHQGARGDVKGGVDQPEQQEDADEDAEEADDLVPELRRGNDQPLHEEGKWEQERQVEHEPLHHVPGGRLHIRVRPGLVAPCGAAVGVRLIVLLARQRGPRGGDQRAGAPVEIVEALVDNPVFPQLVDPEVIQGPHVRSHGQRDVRDRALVAPGIRDVLQLRGLLAA